MNDFTLAHRMFEQAVDIKDGRAVAARVPRGVSSLARALDDMQEIYGAPPMTGRRRKQVDPPVPVSLPFDTKQEQAAAFARWQVSDFRGAREILHMAGLPTPEQLGWRKNALGSSTARQMHPEVAAALEWEPGDPEPVCAPKKGIVAVKPQKWEASRFVPIVGCVHEDVKERDSRREKLLVALIATAARLQRA